MAIIAEKKGEDFKKVEPGTYVARCYSMIEIGTIETEFQGQKKKQRKVNLTWELPTEMDTFNPEKGQEPYVVSKTYTLSMHEKSTLRKDLESWRGKGFTEEEARSFDVVKLLGAPCILSIIHVPGKDDPSKMYVQIGSISRLMKGQECPPQINPTRVLSYDNFDWTIFHNLSDYMKGKIQSSDEYKKLQSPAEVHDNIPDESVNDMPF